MNRKQRRALKARKIAMPQSQDEIKQEYFQLCAQAGELQYKIEEFNIQLKNLNMKIASLNKAFSEAVAAAPEEAKSIPVEGEVSVQEETKAN